ncbi:MAG: HAD family hydrolase [cyanobacterium endosymbiont of Rhopalodia sterrenbergii]
MIISTEPQILALDFDGVICDGLLEYFQTTKSTYTQVWTEHSLDFLDNFADSFYRLRSVIETGWEMPILLRALVLGFDQNQVQNNWTNLCQTIIESDNLNKQALIIKLDEVRDNWIHSDLEGWLKLHRFYPGVIEKIGKVIRSSTLLYIVTTKEGRFVQQLLKKQGVELPRKNILGKEVKQPKYETLRQLIQENPKFYNQLWFVEDLLKTLCRVQQQSDLKEVKLFLANWGFNTSKSHNLAKSNPGINLLSLEQFNDNYLSWFG